MFAIVREGAGLGAFGCLLEGNDVVGVGLEGECEGIGMLVDVDFEVEGLVGVILDSGGLENHVALLFGGDGEEG